MQLHSYNNYIINAIMAINVIILPQPFFKR